jgi:hypothetical protein
LLRHSARSEASCRSIPEEPSPGRTVIKFLDGALVQAMETALKADNPAAAELVACQCVTLAETKDHADWELIKKVAEHSRGYRIRALSKKCGGRVGSCARAQDELIAELAATGT